jgi:hypothetical protein
MSHQHQHSDLMKTILGNMSEYQLPPTEKVTSLWFSDKEHAFLSGKKKVPIPVGTSWEEPDDDEERIVKAVFHPNHKNFDLLYKITFENFLPEVQVKDEYENNVQVAWPRNAYLQTIKLLELVFDNEQSITTLTPESLLVLLQSVPYSCKPYHDQNLGNCPSMNECLYSYIKTSPSPSTASFGRSWIAY